MYADMPMSPRECGTMKANLEDASDLDQFFKSEICLCDQFDAALPAVYWSIRP